MKISEPGRLLLRRIWVAWLFCVIAGSLLPGSSAPIRELSLLPISDKVMHFSAYLLLALLPLVSFESRRRALFGALLMIVMGVALEGGQWFAPGRSVELGDALANTLGVLTGTLAGSLLR